MIPMTVNDLYAELDKLIKMGEGKRKILMTSDDEANQFHHMWFPPELLGENTYDLSYGLPFDLSMDEVRGNYILLS